MAQGQQQNQAVQGVGAVDHKAAAAPAQGVQGQAPAQQTEQKGQAQEKNQAQQGEGAQLAENRPDDVNLTPDAQAEEERRRKEEAEKLQAQIDALMAEIEQIKQQIQQAEQQGDKQKVAQLTDQLHGVETQLGNLIDGVNQPQAAAAPATGAGTIPRPPMAGGAPGLGGGGMNPAAFNPALGGIPGMGSPALGGLGRGGAGNIAPPANPNVQIPNFGPGANKAQIGQMLDAASEKYGIPQNILKAVAWQESGWNPKALSFDGQHGKGVMQIDDRFHEFARTQDVFDPAKNIDYGAGYLKKLYEQTGSWSAALKRYNGGSDYPPKVLALAEQQPWGRYA